MSLTCPGVCRIAGENCQGFLAHLHHHHHCYDDITIANFSLQFISSCCVCVCMCTPVCERVCECDRERNRLALYVIQCVKAPIPISMIISYSLWAKTATLIQFISPLLTGAEMLGPGRSDFWSLSGPRGGRVCFMGGRRKLLVQGRWFWEPWIHNSVFARDKRRSFHEHFGHCVRPWVKAYQFQQYTCLI